jgi:hypothetical protein
MFEFYEENDAEDLEQENSVCFHCLENLAKKGALLADIFKMICDAYIEKSPILACEEEFQYHKYKAAWNYLEYNNYIITHEIDVDTIQFIPNLKHRKYLEILQMFCWCGDFLDDE